MRLRMTSRPQVSGWRFMLRRLEHALVRRETQMLDDPQRSQSLALVLGIVVMVLAAAVCGVIALISPQGTIDASTKIVADRDSGALYVRVGDRFNPVLNLASARLIAGTPAAPKRVKASEIARYPRGPLVGIVGAPQVLTASPDRGSEWTLCNASKIGTAVPLDPATGLPSTAPPVSTSVISGALDMSAAAALPARAGRVMSYANAMWLVYLRADGTAVRARVDTSSPVITTALGIAGAKPLPMGKGLYDALAEELPLTVPAAPDAGASLPYTVAAGAKVGSVLRSTELDGTTTYYVALSSGVQRIGSVVATMLRASNSVGNTAVVEVTPDVVTKAPLSSQLRVGGYPAEPIELVADTSPVTCLRWRQSAGETAATTTLLTGRTLPLTSKQRAAMVSPVTAGASAGATADSIYMPAGAGRFVQIHSDPGATKETLWWLADTGVRYGVDTTDDDSGPNRTVSALGLGEPVAAPWPIVSLFARGPSLSVRDALVVHDGIAADKQAALLPTARPGQGG